MSNTRTSQNQKRLKAAQTFGQYGSTAAGTTGFALDVLGVCVPVAKPLKVGISAFIGLLFGCIGGCNEYKKGDVDERQDLELSQIRRYLHIDEKGTTFLSADEKKHNSSPRSYSPNLFHEIQMDGPATVKMDGDNALPLNVLDTPRKLERKSSLRL